MMLEQYRYIYFLGIGGIGMSALARWFKAKGYPVWGYDKTETALTRKLQEEGIIIHFEDDVQQIPQEVRQHPEQSLIIRTPAVPADHTELNFFLENGFSVKKRSEVLGIITGSSYTVAVAGTHGKTTTSSMVAHLLNFAGKNSSAFLGGISVNLDSNLLIGRGEEAGTVVVEADEFDRSFLTLHPDIAIVTSADADHLDIYGDKSQLTASFRDFISQIRPNGKLIIHESLVAELTTKLDASVTVFPYSLEKGMLHADNITIGEHRFRFNIKSPVFNIDHVELAVPGFHNVENALAAVLAVQLLGVDEEQVRRGMAAYRGVKRRFEYVVEQDGVVYIDDYAHHPAEIDAFLRSLKALYPDRKTRIIFQPHLYTRTRDFADEFARSLSQADELIMLDIYPAREKPIPGITSEIILDKVKSFHKKILRKDQVLQDIMQNRDFEILATVGAGDIDTLVEPIKNILKKQ